MNRDQLLQQVEELATLLAALDRLVPGHVGEDLLAFLRTLPQSPVAADLLLAGLKSLRDAESKTARRAA